jgi:hypothetical protein
MTALIVGGDYVKPIKKIIAGKGVRRIEHWDGRKPSDLRKTFPKDTRLVILLCDYLNHGLAKVREVPASRSGYLLPSFARAVAEARDFMTGGFAIAKAIACCRNGARSHSANRNIDKTKRLVNAN